MDFTIMSCKKPCELLKKKKQPKLVSICHHPTTVLLLNYKVMIGILNDITGYSEAHVESYDVPCV